MKKLSAVLICLLLGSTMGFYHFYQRYQVQKQQTALVEAQLATQQNMINEMHKRQRDIAALDARYTRELNDAQSTIENLQRDVAAGTKRLRLAATCKPLSAATVTAGVDDATRPRLTDAAERDYFRLASRTTLALKQLTGLQEYVRQFCLQPINKGDNR